MSSAEERREARRRRRMGGEDAEETSESSTVNGEDDLERRRRERREARLRATEAPAEEETSSRRSRRHRGGDDETPAEEVTSTRSRRRRGGDDEDAKPKEEPKQEEPAAATDDSVDTASQEAAAAAAAAQAEERRKQQKEEEEEERRREEEKERKQQEAEQRRRDEEERERKEEEEKKRKDVHEDWEDVWKNDVHENTNEQTEDEKTYYFRTKRKKIEANEATVAFYNRSDNESRFVSLMSQGFSSDSLYSNTENMHDKDSDLSNQFTDCDDELETKKNNSENNDAEWETLGVSFCDMDQMSKQRNDEDDEDDDDGGGGDDDGGGGGDGGDDDGGGDDDDDDDNDDDDYDDDDQDTGFDNRNGTQDTGFNNTSGTLSSWKSEACLFSPDIDDSHIERIEASDRCAGFSQSFTDKRNKFNVLEDGLRNTKKLEKKKLSFSVSKDNDEYFHENNDEMATDTAIYMATDITDTAADTVTDIVTDMTTVTATKCEKPTSNTVFEDENDYSVKYGIHLDVNIDYTSSFLHPASVAEVTPIWIENPGESENSRIAPAGHKHEDEFNQDGNDIDYIDPPGKFSDLVTECKLPCDCCELVGDNVTAWNNSSDVMGSSSCIDHFETIEEGTEDFDLSYCYSEPFSVDARESGENDILMEVISMKSEQREGSETSIASIIGSEILSTSSRTSDSCEDEVFEEVCDRNSFSSNVEQQHLQTKYGVSYSRRNQNEINDSECVINEENTSGICTIHNESRNRGKEMAMKQQPSNCSDRISYLTDCVYNQCKYEPDTYKYDEWTDLNQPHNAVDVSCTKKQDTEGDCFNRKRNLDVQTKINSFVVNHSGDAEEHNAVHLQLEKQTGLKDEFQSSTDAVCQSVHVHRAEDQHRHGGDQRGISDLKPDTVMVLGAHTRKSGLTMHEVEMQQPVESSVFESTRHRTSMSSLNYPSSVQTLNEVTHSILQSKADADVTGFLTHSSSSKTGHDVPDSLNHPDSEAQVVLKASASAFLGKLVDNLPVKPKRVCTPNFAIVSSTIPLRNDITELNSKSVSYLSSSPMKATIGSSNNPSLKDKEISNSTAIPFQSHGHVSSEIQHCQTDLILSRNQNKSDDVGEVKEVKTSIKMIGRKVLPAFNELEKSKLWEKQAQKNHQEELEIPKYDSIKQKEETMLFVGQTFDQTDSESSDIQNSDIQKPSHLPLWLRIHRNSLPGSAGNSHSLTNFTDHSLKKRHSMMPKISLYLKHKHNLDSTDNSVLSSEDFSPDSSFVSESGSSIFTEDGTSRTFNQRLHSPFLKTQSTPALYKHVSHYGSDYSVQRLQHATSLQSVQIVNCTAKPWQSSSPETSARSPLKSCLSPRFTCSKAYNRRVSVPELRLGHGGSPSSSPRSPSSSVLDRRVSSLGISGRHASSIESLSQHPSVTRRRSVTSSSPRWLKTQSLIFQSDNTETDNHTEAGHSSVPRHGNNFSNSTQSLSRQIITDSTHSFPGDKNTIVNSARSLPELHNNITISACVPGHQNFADSTQISSKKQDPSSSLTHVKKEKLWRQQKQTELVGVIRARQNANLLIGTYPLSEQVEQLEKSLQYVEKSSVSPRDKPKRSSPRRVLTVREKYCLDENDSDEMSSEDIGRYGFSQQVCKSKMAEDSQDFPVVPAQPIVGNSSLLQRIENIKSHSERFIRNCRNHISKRSDLSGETVKAGHLESVMISGNVHLSSGPELKKKQQENMNYEDLRQKRRNSILNNTETRKCQEEMTPQFETFRNLNTDVATSEKSRQSVVAMNLPNQEALVTSAARQFQSLIEYNEIELRLSNNVHDDNFRNDEMDSAKHSMVYTEPKSHNNELISINTTGDVRNNEQLTGNFVCGGSLSNQEVDKLKQMDAYTGGSHNTIHDNKTQSLQSTELEKTPDPQIEHNIVKERKDGGFQNRSYGKSLSCIQSPQKVEIISADKHTGLVERRQSVENASELRYATLLHRFETMSKEVTETVAECEVKNNHVRRSLSGSRVSDYKSKFLNVASKDNITMRQKSSLNLTECVDLAMCQRKVANHPELQINVTNYETDKACISRKMSISDKTLPNSNSCPKFNTESNSLTSKDSNVNLLKSKFLTSPVLVNSLTHSNSCPKLSSSVTSDKTHLQREIRSETSPANERTSSDHNSLLEKFEKLTQDLMESEALRLEDIKTDRRMKIRRLSSGLDITELQKKFTKEKQASRGCSPNPFVIDSIRRNCSLHSSWQQLAEPPAREDISAESVSTHRGDQNVTSTSVHVAKIASKFKQDNQQSDNLPSKTNKPSTRTLSKLFHSESRIPDRNYYCKQPTSDVSHEGDGKSEVLKKTERLASSKGSYVTNIIGKYKQSSCESSKLKCCENVQSHQKTLEGSSQQSGDVSNSGPVHKMEKTLCSPSSYVTNIAGRFEIGADLSSKINNKQYQNEIACSKVNTASLHNAFERFPANEDTRLKMQHSNSQITERKPAVLKDTVIHSAVKTANCNVVPTTNQVIERRKTVSCNAIPKSDLYVIQRRKTLSSLSKSIPDQLQLKSPASCFQKRNSIASSSSVQTSELNNVKSRTNSSATAGENSALCFESLLNMKSLAINVTEQQMAQGLVWSPQTSPDLRKSETDLTASSSFSWNSHDEEEARMEEERQDRERQEQEEEARRKKEEEQLKKKGKRKGLGGLSPEKKKLLKKLIMQKAAEDLRNEAKKKAEEKERFINAQVPELNTAGMNQADLQQLCKRLHDKICVLEEEVFDWEVKIRKQDFEINNLQLKFNDAKGKFIKPVLRKVNKTESKLAKLDKKESRDFRSNLKSTGQNKFALEDEKESKKPEWREQLKKEGEGEAEAEEAQS